MKKILIILFILLTGILYAQPNAHYITGWNFDTKIPESNMYYWDTSNVAVSNINPSSPPNLGTIYNGGYILIYFNEIQENIRLNFDIRNSDIKSSVVIDTIDSDDSWDIFSQQMINTETWQTVSLIISRFRAVRIRTNSKVCIDNIEIVDIPLPVKIEYFDYAIIYDNNIQLKWKTIWEENNDRFDVYRNNQLITSIKGNGNTSEPKEYLFLDTKLNCGKYNYYLKQFDYNGNFEIIPLIKEITINIPNKIELLQNYPNPFNNSTKMDFNLNQSTYVTLKIFDVTGRLIDVIIDNKKYNAGYYTLNYINFLPSGIYYYSLITEKTIITKKMVIIK